jgi:fructosamine-3-kinase
VRRVERVIGRLETLIPQRPKPALLHGDLWSGNALTAVDEAGAQRIAVIDPACSYGDGWADIAMMKLFGGFPSHCLDAYAAEADDRDGLEARLAVYQLYHVLNHVNLFGRSYAGQAMALVAALGA